jgi:hypothetical protein
MLDQAVLKPVIISMAVYLMIAKIIPAIIKTPTRIAVIDDLNMSLIAQGGSLSSGAITTALVTLITFYIIDQELI